MAVDFTYVLMEVVNLSKNGLNIYSTICYEVKIIKNIQLIRKVKIIPKDRYLQFTYSFREVGNLNKMTNHMPLKSKRNLSNCLINFQRRIILIRKTISSWLPGISLNKSETTHQLIIIPFLCVETNTSQYEATFWSDPTKTKKSLEIELVCP